jgi:hypothetical protein
MLVRLVQISSYNDGVIGRKTVRRDLFIRDQCRPRLDDARRKPRPAATVHQQRRQQRYADSLEASR